MKTTKEKTTKQKLNECRLHLGCSLEQLSDYLQDDCDSEMHGYLAITKLKASLVRIFGIETRIYELLSRQVEVADVGAVAKDFVANDEDAFKKKDSIVPTLMSCGDWGEHRAVIRGILRPHWDLLDGMREAVFEGKVQEEICKLKEELEKTKWLFRVFVSYASEDEGDVSAFVSIAEEIPKLRYLALWKYTSERKGGDKIDCETQEDIRQSEMSVIFVTDSFMESARRRFIGENELPVMLEERRINGKPMFPIYLKDLEGGGNEPDWYRSMDHEPKEGSVAEICGMDDEGVSAAEREAKKAKVFENLARKVGDRMDELSALKSYQDLVARQKKYPALGSTL